jgi:hypothetical protein
MTLSPPEALASSLCNTQDLGVFGVLGGQRLRKQTKSGIAKKKSIDIRSKKFGKYVQVIDSSHRLPSILARHVERCRPTNFEQKSSAVGVEGHVE